MSWYSQQQGWDGEPTYPLPESDIANPPLPEDLEASSASNPPPEANAGLDDEDRYVDEDSPLNGNGYLNLPSLESLESRLGIDSDYNKPSQPSPTLGDLLPPSPLEGRPSLLDRMDQTLYAFTLHSIPGDLAAISQLAERMIRHAAAIAPPDYHLMTNLHGLGQRLHGWRHDATGLRQSIEQLIPNYMLDPLDPKGMAEIITETVARMQQLLAEHQPLIDHLQDAETVEMTTRWRQGLLRQFVPGAEAYEQVLERGNAIAQSDCLKTLKILIQYGATSQEQRELLPLWRAAYRWAFHESFAEELVAGTYTQKDGILAIPDRLDGEPNTELDIARDLSHLLTQTPLRALIGIQTRLASNLEPLIASLYHWADGQEAYQLLELPDDQRLILSLAAACHYSPFEPVDDNIQHGIDLIKALAWRCLTAPDTDNRANAEKAVDKALEYAGGNELRDAMRHLHTRLHRAIYAVGNLRLEEPLQQLGLQAEIRQPDADGQKLAMTTFREQARPLGGYVMGEN